MIGKILASGFVCAAIAVAQTATAPVTAPPIDPAATATPAPTATPAKAYAFDVVSIRRSISGDGGDFGMPTPGGYRMTNGSLFYALLMAYVPQMGGAATYAQAQIKGLPDWEMSENYTIDARISDEDRAAWQNPAEQKVMLRSMLQAMLAERCKLVVHREVKDATVYSLVVGKNGIKFKKTDPTVDPPSGKTLPWGGVVVGRIGNESFYGTPMTTLASFLSNILSNTGEDGSVQDKTGGLAGQYDFVIKFPPYEPRGQDEAQGSITATDPSSLAFTLAEALGLKLVKSKGQVETLVIDHIERPSPN